MIPEWLIGFGALNIALALVTGGTIENDITLKTPFLQTLVMFWGLALFVIVSNAIQNYYRDNNLIVMKTTTITIAEEQHKWVQHKCINLSKFVRAKLEEEMEKE